MDPVNALYTEQINYISFHTTIWLLLFDKVVYMDESKIDHVLKKYQKPVNQFNR